MLCFLIAIIAKTAASHLTSRLSMHVIYPSVIPLALSHVHIVPCVTLVLLDDGGFVVPPTRAEIAEKEGQAPAFVCKLPALPAALSSPPLISALVYRSLSHLSSVGLGRKRCGRHPRSQTGTEGRGGGLQGCTRLRL